MGTGNQLGLWVVTKSPALLSLSEETLELGVVSDIPQGWCVLCIQR